MIAFFKNKARSKLRFTALDTNSRRKLQRGKVDPRLIVWATRVGELWPVKVLEVIRSIDRQQEMINTKKSKLTDPWEGKHVHGMAIDIVPIPIDWKYLRSFYWLAGIGFAVAAEMGLKMRWGGNWDRDFDLRDNEFLDAAHWEIDEPVPPKPLT